MSKKLLLFFFFIGVFYRLLIVIFLPQPFIFDQNEYKREAVRIYNTGFYIDSHRTYGFPMLLALNYKIFGLKSESWKLMHALMDSGTAVLIYLIAIRLFKNKKPAYIGFFATLFNPITCAYVGVALTEISTIFFLALGIYLFVRFMEKNSFSRAVPASVVLGFLPQVKPTFVFFTIILMSVILYKFITSIKDIGLKIFISMLTVYIYLIPFYYNMIANIKIYGQFSPLTVDNLFVREFYISLFVDHAVPTNTIPPEVTTLYIQYSDVNSPLERRMMTEKYANLAIEKIKKDPQKFITDRIKKLWYVWEKYAFFTYTNQRIFWIRATIYCTNILVLAAAAYGIFRWRQTKDYIPYFGRIFVILVIYISVLHAFTNTDGRFSIPVYPYIFMFMGYGIWVLTNNEKIQTVLRRFNKLNSFTPSVIAFFHQKKVIK